jgi:integrase
VAQNVALRVKIGVSKHSERARLKVGVDIPTSEEIRKIVQVLNGLEGNARRFRPVLLITGLRACELRGLRWEDIDLKRGEVTVRQRADRYHQIGHPKSRSGERTIPIGQDFVNILKAWKLACPNGELGSAFPSVAGKIDPYSNIVHKFEQVVRAAGLLDRLGQPKYTGRMPCGISMRRGASTARTTVDWNCQPRWCRRGSETLPSS